MEEGEGRKIIIIIKVEDRRGRGRIIMDGEE